MLMEQLAHPSKSGAKVILGCIAYMKRPVQCKKRWHCSRPPSWTSNPLLNINTSHQGASNENQSAWKTRGHQRLKRLNQDGAIAQTCLQRDLGGELNLMCSIWCISYWMGFLETSVAHIIIELVQWWISYLIGLCPCGPLVDRQCNNFYLATMMQVLTMNPALHCGLTWMWPSTYITRNGSIQLFSLPSCYLAALGTS